MSFLNFIDFGKAGKDKFSIEVVIEFRFDESALN